MIRPLALVLGLTAGPAAAEAIAFAQGPELLLGVGIGPSYAEAMSDAVTDCGAPDFCVVTTACSTGTWSLVLHVDHVDAVEWNEVYCGFASREAVAAAAPALCDSGARPDLKTCELAQVFDPEGRPTLGN